MIEETRETQNTPNIEKKAIKVLVVADDCFTHSAVANMLQASEDILLVDKNIPIEEAEKAIQEIKPDVTLFDAGNGCPEKLEVAQKLVDRELPGKLALLLDNDSAEAVRQSMKVDARGYISKSVSSEYLSDALRQIASGKLCVGPYIAKRLVDFCKSYKPEGSAAYSKPAYSDFRMPDRFTAQQTGSNTNQFQTTPFQAFRQESRSPSIEELQLNREKTKEKERMINIITTREMEMLPLLVQGLTNREIASRLFISVSTTKTHLHNLFEKLNVHDRTQASVKALKLGLIEL